jgi:hypothetical protein
MGEVPSGWYSVMSNLRNIQHFHFEKKELFNSFIIKYNKLLFSFGIEIFPLNNVFYLFKLFLISYLLIFLQKPTFFGVQKLVLKI